MSSIPLYKAFIEVGASEQSATKAAEDVIQVSQLPQLATKADIALLKSDISLLEEKITADTALLEKKITADTALLQEKLTAAMAKQNPGLSNGWSVRCWLLPPSSSPAVAYFSRSCCPPGLCSKLQGWGRTAAYSMRGDV